jgi:hypothetical protein
MSAVMFRRGRESKLGSKYFVNVPRKWNTRQDSCPLTTPSLLSSGITFSWPLMKQRRKGWATPLRPVTPHAVPG